MYKTVFKASFRYLTSLISEQTLWWFGGFFYAYFN